MLIVTAFIYTNTCPWVWLKIFCGPYPNRKYGFASPAGLSKVMARVLVECNRLFKLIDCFNWSKISLKLFTYTFFLLLLTYVYWNYCIRVHWSWNMLLGVIKNCLLSVYKSDIGIFFPIRFVEGRGEDSGCVVALDNINLLTVLNSIIPSYSCWFLFTLFLSVE